MMRTYTIPASRRPAALAALALSLVAAGCSKASPKPDSVQAQGAPATSSALALGPQDVATVQSVGGGSTISISGPLLPKEQVTLRAQVGGTVANLRVDRGSAVRAGQVLATIRAAGVQSQAAGARAGVAAAEANLAVAQQRLEAANTLRQAGAMSDIDYRSAQAGFRSAEAQLAAARAQSAGASEAAGYTTIVSPINGIVSTRKVQEGEAVNPGGELLTVVNGRVLELAGQIAVGDAGLVRVGQAVTFALDAYPTENFRGRVARIDPVADAGTRQVGVYVELPNPNGRIVGGTYGRGTIATGAASKAQRLVIPSSAIQADAAGGASTVLVIENGKVTRRAVTLGERDETGGVTVLAGLRAGEQVIAVPSPDVKEGVAVSLAAPVAPAGSPNALGRK